MIALMIGAFSIGLLVAAFFAVAASATSRKGG